jgi:hypothetical protein
MSDSERGERSARVAGKLKGLSAIADVPLFQFSLGLHLMERLILMQLRRKSTLPAVHDHKAWHKTP